MKIKLAIVINMVDEVLLECENIMHYLNYNHSINFILNSQIVSHLALSSGEINECDIHLVSNKIKESLENTYSFKIKTNGLGVFLSEDINIHLRWGNDIEMMTFKKKIENLLKEIWVQRLNYNDTYTWLPKTSLAFKDIKYSDLSSIDFGNLKIKDKTMDVKSLSLIQFEEGKKEKEIMKFFLKEKING